MVSGDPEQQQHAKKQNAFIKEHLILGRVNLADKSHKFRRQVFHEFRCFKDVCYVVIAPGLRSRQRLAITRSVFDFSTCQIVIHVVVKKAPASEGAFCIRPD